MNTQLSEHLVDEFDATLRSAWPVDSPMVTNSVEISGGRGVFSRVYAADLAWPAGRSPNLPDRVVLKLPALGPNRIAATVSGAYKREELAYRSLLLSTPIETPVFFGSHTHDDGAVALVLEDLRHGRGIDQILGLDKLDASLIAADLGRWHHPSRWPQQAELATRFQIRTSVPRGLNDEALRKGLTCLQTTWADVLSTSQIMGFERLVRNRDELTARFESGPDSLCHGDVRADNLVFDVDARPLVFFDWQQMAVQIGEADMAWLAATSLEPPVRRSTEKELVSLYAEAAGLDPAESWDRYRTAFVLPGLAVLFLAQRELDTDRARRFVATSLSRIATALADHELT